MARKWTSERNERFLLLIVENVKVDYKKLAAKYAEKYEEDEFKPTPKAITEQFAVLRKKAGVNSGAKGGAASKGAQSKGTGTPRTPKRSIAPDTSSSSKRKRDAMSDENDSEPDQATASPSKDLAGRTSHSRASKSAARKYDHDDSDEEAEADDESDAKPVKLQNGGGLGSDLFHHHLSFDGAAERKPFQLPVSVRNRNSTSDGKLKMLSNGTLRNAGSPSTKRTKTIDSGDDSDVSSYSNHFN